MLPAFLMPEAVLREAGTGPALSLGSTPGGVLILTLGITRIIEQQSLDVSIWGSSDGADWGTKPIISFPQKFYCGTYQLLLDLSQHPDVKHLRAKWAVSRWGRGDPKPLFGVYLFAQEAGKPVAASQDGVSSVYRLTSSPRRFASAFSISVRSVSPDSRCTNVFSTKSQSSL